MLDTSVGTGSPEFHDVKFAMYGHLGKINYRIFEAVNLSGWILRSNGALM